MEYNINTEMAQSKAIQRMKDILAMEIITQEIDKMRIEQETYRRAVAEIKGWIAKFIVEKAYKNITDIKLDLKKFIENKE